MKYYRSGTKQELRHEDGLRERFALGAGYLVLSTPPNHTQSAGDIYSIEQYGSTFFGNATTGLGSL
jgi:hypothetical protein